MDYELALMTGVDIPLEQPQIIIHQPTLKEISMIGQKTFFSGIQFICINKKIYDNEADKNLLNQITNFQLFMNIISDKRMSDKKRDVISCFNLLFPNWQINIVPQRSLLLNLNEENVIIDEQSFDNLQQILRKMFKIDTDINNDFNPIDERAAAIAKKLQRGRDRVAAQKRAKGEGTNSLGQYVSILPFACPSMSVAEICNLTIYQLYTLIERYGLYVNWDLDIRTRLAGGSPDSKPENWMKNL